MDKNRSHLDGEPDKLLAFKKGPLVSSTSNEDNDLQSQFLENKKRQFLDNRPSANLSKYGPAPDPKKSQYSIEDQYSSCRSR
jgi:hypothetical protein